MNTIKEYFERHRRRMEERKRLKIVRRSQELYQICEYNDNLWLTFNGALICPTDMLYSPDSVKALVEIRNLYVERNTVHHGE